MSKSIKIILGIIFFLFLLFFVLSASVPALVSTPYGKETALKWINSTIKGKISADDIKLSWFGSQRIQNLRYDNKKGVTTFSCRSFETETPLIYLALSRKNLKNTTLEEPYLKISSSSKEEKKEKKKKSKSNKKNFSFPNCKSSLLVTQGTLELKSDNLAPVTVTEVYIKKSADSQQVRIEAVTQQGQALGHIYVDAALDDTIRADVKVKDFPIAILDNLADTTLFTESLGPSLNLDLDLIRESDTSLLIKGAAQSAHLNAFVDGHARGGEFVLHPNTNLDLSITPSFFKQLIEEKRRGDWELASKTHLQVQLEKGSFALKKDFEFSQLALSARATIDRAELHHKAVGNYTLKHFEATIDAHKQIDLSFQSEILGKEATNLAGNITFQPTKEVTFDYACQGVPVTLLELVSMQLSQKVRLLFGKQFDMDGKGKWTQKMGDAHFNMRSIDTEVKGHMTGTYPELSLELTGSRKIHGDAANITGDKVHFYVQGTGKYEKGSLVVPFIKGILFNPYFACDIKGQIGEDGKPFSLDQIQITAVGNIKKLPFEEEKTEAALQNATLFFQVDGAKNLITGKAEATGLETSFTINNFITDGALSYEKVDSSFSCNLSDFPLSEIGPFISDDLDLKSLFGKHVSLTAKGNYNHEKEHRLVLDVNAKGVGFSTALSFTVDDKRAVKQLKPSYIYWEITPERFDALLELFHTNPYEPIFALTRQTQLELNITHFTCPTAPTKNLGHFLCQSGFVGDLKLGTLSFLNKMTQETITIQEVTGALKGENFSQAIDISLSGSLLPNVPQAEKSSFDFTGQMFNFWSQAGKFNREGLTVKGELNLNHLPVHQITEMLVLDQGVRKITQALLGESVNAHMSGEISQLQGPVTIDVTSSNFKAKLPLQLHRNAIYLRDYVDAEISLTNAVNETFLKDINPLLITGAYSDHPLKVYIDPQGFVFPIRPYSLENVQIANAIVDIGRIHVRNGGQIQSLMEFLRAREITPDGFMQAWFTPIFMTLHNGVATYKRFDALLAGNVHIAMWGNINLINDKVRMTLAVAPTTLYQRFKITGLTKKDMFQVKMRGTTNKLKLDWSSAYSRIAWIVARSAAGQLTNIIGGILEQLIGGRDEETPPPPTTEPLPWESLYPSEPGQSIPQESRRSKGLKQILHSLFPR